MAQYIPEKHTVVYRKDDDAINPLAFMVPFGTDSAYEKRVSTARSWARGRNSEKPIEHTFNNEPMIGFEITKNVSRWSTSNVAWRIVDPRGFELEIYSDNMNYIIAHTTIVNGVIQDPLQWVRDGSYNYLLPVKSEKYADYVNTTAIIKDNVKLSSFVIGDIVKHEDDEYIFLGRFTTVNFSLYDVRLVYPNYQYMFLYKPKNDGDWRSPTLHKVTSSWKGVYPIGKTELSAEDALKKVYEIESDTIYACHGKFKGKYDITFTPITKKGLVTSRGSIMIDIITDNEYVVYNVSKYNQQGCDPAVYAYPIHKNPDGTYHRDGNGVMVQTVDNTRRGYYYNSRKYESILTREKLKEKLDSGRMFHLTCVIDGKPNIIRD